jgi:hypothetical protein
MSFNMVTVVWGKMIDWYSEWHIPSLLQPGNLPALKDARYFVYTDEQERVGSLLSTAITSTPVQVLPLVKGRGRVNDCFKDCAGRIQGHMALMSPDNIFGDGSLRNLESYCEKFDLVLYGFPRCDLSVVEEILPILKQNKAVSNAQLVSFAMKHLHREAAPPTLHLKRMAGNTWQVQHLGPTPIIRINEKSLSFINSMPSNNSLIDHCVPIMCIEAGMSFHLVQDSDEVFMVEPTHRRSAFCPTESYEGEPEWTLLAEKNANFWKDFSITWTAPESAGHIKEKKRGVLERCWTAFGGKAHMVRRQWFPGWLSRLCLKIFYRR